MDTEHVERTTSKQREMVSSEYQDSAGTHIYTILKQREMVSGKYQVQGQMEIACARQISGPIRHNWREYLQYREKW